MGKNLEDKEVLETLFDEYDQRNNPALISFQDAAYELGYKRGQQDQKEKKGESP